MEQYFKIGKIVGTHGVDGKVVLQHSLGRKTDFLGLKAVFIEHLKEQFMPYFLGSAVAKSESETFLVLDGIGSKEAAKKVLKKEVWLTKDAFNQYAAAHTPIGLLGFTVFDGSQKLGEVEEVFEQPHQVLCRVMVDGHESLIPVHEGVLEQINYKRREIFLNLPPGLLEIYRT